MIVLVCLFVSTIFNDGAYNDMSSSSIIKALMMVLYLFMFESLEPVFPFIMFSAKQGKYWYHFYNVFSMTRSLTGD